MQMVSIDKTNQDVKMVYYVIRDEKVVDATLVSRVIGYLHKQEVAMLLGYIVKTVATRK